MSNGNLTHWKKMKDPNFLGSWDLVKGANNEGEPVYDELVVKIDYAKQETVLDPRTNKNKDVVVCYFKNCKPMILNSTNMKAITKVCKSPFMEYWKNCEVTIYVQTKLKAFGDFHDALRIKDFAPKPRKIYKCVDCGADTTEEIALYTEKVLGRQLCKSCGKKAKNELETTTDTTEEVVVE